jgi:hypothetical protein
MPRVALHPALAVVLAAREVLMHVRRAMLRHIDRLVPCRGLAGVFGFEPELPDDCVAKAELAIKLVATSAAANFVNIVFSCFAAPMGDSRRCSRRCLRLAH